LINNYCWLGLHKKRKKYKNKKINKSKAKQNNKTETKLTTKNGGGGITAELLF